ncbi:DUF6884 domain-containing protein [Halalkalicoccus sp. NIPERK01]|uniref:DUF6884 domain-containing protein n=1 Tax=Halalkalicoccus sp. NIPERK01 TaxID=3053469 RepID=UPI00256F2262|nr:DUF6884 domain-containing protein [Halalkalicoccus sp. NIPERK01]MDL5361333.1 hypothetical protein [Halalkalicoccus sp. NIPERK01]
MSADLVRFTYVGCGKAKREIDGHPNHAKNQYPAAALYTSNYFALKRRYAERASESWWILSAKHGPIHPFVRLKHYDVTMSDYPIEGGNAPFETIENWAEHVVEQVGVAVRRYQEQDEADAVDEIVMLAGKDYLDPVRDGLSAIADEFDLMIRYPFDDTSGIGEQMAWLKNQTDHSAPVSPRYRHIFTDEIREVTDQ